MITIIERCHCYDPKYPMFIKSQPCKNYTQYKCISEQYYNVLNWPMNFTTKYTLNCPLECESIDYDAQVSSSDYPSVEYYDFFMNGSKENLTQLINKGIDLSTFESFKQYFYSMNIFYANTEYTIISETPQQTFIDLLTNLGGSLGMFLGFSVFSLLEVFEILFEIILTLIFKN